VKKDLVKAYRKASRGIFKDVKLGTKVMTLKKYKPPKYIGRFIKDELIDEEEKELIMLKEEAYQTLDS